MATAKNIVNEEVYEAINARPSWIVRNGLLFIFCMILIILIFSNFVTYPEFTSFPVKIISQSKSFNHTIPSNNSILFLKKETVVNKGELIAIIGTPDTVRFDTIFSPMQGKLYSFFDFKTSQTFFKVIPDSMSYAVYGEIDQDIIKKVHEGQVVKIDLASYTADKWGDLTGKVLRVSPLPVEQHYSIEIILDNGLVTTDGQNISLVDSLAGQGKIVLERKSVFRRIFKQILPF